MSWLHSGLTEMPTPSLLTGAEMSHSHCHESGRMSRCLIYATLNTAASAKGRGGRSAVRWRAKCLVTLAERTAATEKGDYVMHCARRVIAHRVLSGTPPTEPSHMKGGQAGLGSPVLTSARSAPSQRAASANLFCASWRDMTPVRSKCDNG